MALAVFDCFDKLEKQSTAGECEKEASENDALAAAKQLKKLQKLRDRKTELLQKLQQRKEAIAKFEDAGGDLKSLEDHDVQILYELEKQRRQQLLASYRLTGTSVEVTSEKTTMLRFDTMYENSYLEPFYLELETSKEPFTVNRHSLPSFIPLGEVKDHLSKNGVKVTCDYIRNLLRPYIVRRQEVLMVQALLPSEVSCSPSYDYVEIEFKGETDISKLRLTYADLHSTLPTNVHLESHGADPERLEEFKRSLTSAALSKVFQTFFTVSDSSGTN